MSLGLGLTPTDIAVGYGHNVKAALFGPYAQFYTKVLAGGIATVQHAGGGFGADGGSSTNAASCVDQWLGGERWDAIVFNAGLDDCAGASARLNDTAYAANIRAVLTKAAAASTRVVFVATTPFSPKVATHSLSCVARANAVARDAAAAVNASSAGGGRVDFAGLDGFVSAFCGGVNYTSCPIQLDGDVHFSTVWSPPWPVDPSTKRPLQRRPAPSGQQYTALSVARAIQRAVPADKIRPPINASGPFFRLPLSTPSGDSAVAASPCGLPPAALNASNPNVLIIGDSVSDTGSGYGPYVRALLEPLLSGAANDGGNPRANGLLAQVQHSGGWSGTPGANEQAANTANGVKCIASWLGDLSSGFTWDVVSLNFGIHDCWGPQFVNATQYRANLEAIYDAVHASLAPDGTVVWASTTPIATNCTTRANPKGCYGVKPSCVAEYNAIAADVFGAKPDAVVCDVYAAVNRACGANFTTCSLQHEGDVHPSGPGKQFLAIEVAATIAPLLGPRWRRIMAGQ